MLAACRKKGGQHNMHADAWTVTPASAWWRSDDHQSQQGTQRASQDGALAVSSQSVFTAAWPQVAVSSATASSIAALEPPLPAEAEAKVAWPPPHWGAMSSGEQLPWPAGAADRAGGAGDRDSSVALQWPTSAQSARPVSHFLRVHTDSACKTALALPRPTAAPTAALALQRHHY